MGKLEIHIMESEKRERLLVPVLGFCAVMTSMVMFLVVLYIITIGIRFLFVFG